VSFNFGKALTLWEDSRLAAAANFEKSPGGVVLEIAFTGGDEIGGTTPFASCVAGAGTAFAGTAIAATKLRAARTATKPRTKDRAKVTTKYQLVRK
jgi:hypothetical protein